MTYATIMESLEFDGFTLEVEQEWCECQDWNGGQCVIKDGGEHDSRVLCEGSGLASSECCPGVPEEPQCN